MKNKWILCVILVFIFICITYILWFKEADEKYVFQDSRFSYIFRGEPNYSLGLYKKNENFDIFILSIPTRPLMAEKAVLSAFLIIPHSASNKNIPAVVLLPGGGGTKESRIPFAEVFVRQGYAVIILDQRGIGQTRGRYLSIEEDYNVFLQGFEPLQHLSVYDALRAFDVLISLPKINKNKIIFVGESMGGRYALIATALEPRSAGVISVSSSGLNVRDKLQIKPDGYLSSIDPDNYIASISPRPTVFIHDTEDNIISLNDAQHTFDLAGKPKRFIIHKGCNHGFCPSMNSTLDESLKFIYSKDSEDS